MFSVRENPLRILTLTFLILTVLMTHSALLLCFHSNGVVDLKVADSAAMGISASQVSTHLKSASSCFDFLLTLGHAGADQNLFHAFLPTTFVVFLSIIVLALGILAGVQSLAQDRSKQLKIHSEYTSITPLFRTVLTNTVLLL